jgi:uncharacterized membrane protein
MTIANPNGGVGPIGAEVDEFLDPATDPNPPTPPQAGTSSADGAPALQTAALDLADQGFADAIGSAFGSVASAFPAAMAAALRGEWFGHPVHPALTDFPLGCWTSASLLDLVGGRAARPAATRLVALGLLGAPVAAAAGLADWEPIDPERERRARRVGATHAAANVAATVCYLVSWRARRRNRHALGVTTALAGAAITLYSGYLGGELVFGVPEHRG